MRLNKTIRRRRQRRQRSRRHRRSTRRQRGGTLPVPPGSVVAVSTQGEYGVPTLMSKERFLEEQEKGSLEE
jgi:hypothetical protein